MIYDYSPLLIHIINYRFSGENVLNSTNLLIHLFDFIPLIFRLPLQEKFPILDFHDKKNHPYISL